ncbi:MAG: insulinase family protein, partial [Tepidisphaeraceae bacterium]
DIAQEPPVVGPRTLVATFPKLGQARIDLAFASVKEDSPDMYALDLLATILGGSESAALVEDLRDNRQVVSTVSAEDWTPSFVDGSFMIDLQTDAAKVQPAIAATLADLADIRAHGVDDASLQRAKTEMKMARLKQMQTSQDVAASLATDYLSSGDPHFSDRYVERVGNVTAAQVQAAAVKYLDPGKLLTTVMLPEEAVGSAGLPKAEDLIRPAVQAQTPGSTSSSPAEQIAGPSTVQRFVLDNGTVLLLKRFTNTPLVTVRMYSLGGVTAEDASTNGLGNLTMVSLQRGAGGKSAEQIAEYFDSIGAEFGASCGNNTWSWAMSCTKDDLPSALAQYADIVLHPTFADDQVGEMKQRLAAEISSQDAEWHNRAFRFFKQEFYGPSNSPYQFMPIGTAENVQKFTAAQMKQWYADKILSAPRVLTIFGDVDPEQAKDMAQKLLGGGAKVPPIAARTFAPADHQADNATPFLNVTQVKVQKTEQGPASVVVGFQSDSIIGEPSEPTAIRAFTLAGGFSYPTGYIFETLRGLGLSYEAAAYDQPGQSAQIPGTMIAYAECDPSKVTEVGQRLLVNMARLQGTDTDMQADWFGRSRDLITTGDALDHETPDSQAEQSALDELFGLGYDYHLRFPDQIGAVTLDDVRAYARNRLRNCVVTVCTPDPDSVKIPTGKVEYSSFPIVDLTPKGIQLDTGAPR